jgi:hypothetical protein
MLKKIDNKGMTVLEIVVAMSVFLIFAIGVYSGISIVFKIVYNSRLHILETAILSEQLEVARNLTYENVGISGGVPVGVLEHTKTVSRNNLNFNIITTVRNYDDPFDGTVGGSPNDTSPADYKLVEMSIICQNCPQKTPVILSTRVSPKGLEGASQNGALFINIFNAYGQPVPGANVYIANTSANPDIIINDTTDNEGWLRIVDTPTGTQTYNIAVSKNGYSTDYTMYPSVTNTNPTKLPSNVASQTVTEISFAIDEVGSLAVSTMNDSCAVIGDKTVNMRGEKIIGKNSETDFVYKYNKSITTDGSGNYNLSNVEWDKYYFTASGTTYDVAGSIPFMPVDLTPGLDQNVSLILLPHTTHSLLVQVKDAGTNLPLSDASVRLYKSGYDETLSTGIGYERQTDWSGGSGQVNYVLENKYFADNGNISRNLPVGDLKLRKSGSRYVTPGWLESSTFDMGTSSVTYRNIIFEPLSQPSQTGVNSLKFQLAFSVSSTPASWSYTGPNGTASTYYTSTSTIIYSGNNNKRYFRYKAYLSTANTLYTPTLSEVSFTYTNNCTPPGQAFFTGLSANTYTLDVSRAGYTSNSASLDVSGYTQRTEAMSTL